MKPLLLTLWNHKKVISLCQSTRLKCWLIKAPQNKCGGSGDSEGRVSSWTDSWWGCSSWYQVTLFQTKPYHFPHSFSGPSKNHGWDGLSRRIEGVATPPLKSSQTYLFLSLFKLNINLKILDPPLNSLWNKLSPRWLLLGCFGRREVCTSLTEIPYWWHKSMFTCKSGSHEFVWCYDFLGGLR